jgi:isopentenyldiphosphate isomerase
MNEASEKLDLVNDDDQVIGAITRGEIKDLFNTSGRYVRYANCFIQNAEGKLWIPRRTATKSIAPNGLDFSASEHVQAGESYLEAAVRGLQEELDIHLDARAVSALGKLKPDRTRPYFSSIYIVSQDDAPNYNTTDFTGYEWLTARELRARLDDGVAKADLAPAVKLLTSK